MGESGRAMVKVTKLDTTLSKNKAGYWNIWKRKTVGHIRTYKQRSFCTKHGQTGKQKSKVVRHHQAQGRRKQITSVLTIKSIACAHTVAPTNLKLVTQATNLEHTSRA